MNSRFEVLARNPATASENRIHADDVARQHGFRGGLVPGVTVFGYAVRAMVAALGARWVEGGAVDARFLAPCYDGDLLEIIAVSPEEAPAPAGATAFDPAGSVRIEVRAEGELRVTAIASLPAGAGLERPDRTDLSSSGIPFAELPPSDARPPAGKESLAPGTVLGAVAIRTDPEALADYCGGIDEVDPTFFERGWVHPGMLLEAANWVLSRNVVMPLWLHVGSVVQYVRAVALGEDLSVRGRVAEEWERRGHRFVRLEVTWVAGGEVVAVGHHTAIWSLAPRQP